MFRKIAIIGVLCILLGAMTPLTIVNSHRITTVATNDDPLSVTLHVIPGTMVYEGDIVNCTITGNPQVKYWQINGQNHHTLFSGDDPVLFDPEPTPLNDTYVNLTVTVVNGSSSASDTVQIQLKRLFFGDIHFHSSISDGYNKPETMYKNAITDNYLDFVCMTDHGELINQQDITPPQPIWMWLRSFVQVLKYKFLGQDEWKMEKDNVRRFNNPGNFTTFLGFEYSSGPFFPGGSPFSPNNHQDECHICFLYRDLYEDAQKYSAWNQLTFDDIFAAMNAEWEKGHLNIGFPHHPIMQIKRWGAYTVNWTFLANMIKNTSARDRVLRGAEMYSRWGLAIGKYSGTPIEWPYAPLYIRDRPEFWVENALWEWSKDARKNQRFVLEASSDTHGIDRPGSASTKNERLTSGNPSGIVAAYATHNTRGEIWDALNNCSIYGLQTLKIRANVRFDGQMALGRWINCTAPLKIQITAQSTFPGLDSSGRAMCPNGYNASELSYPIQDIWLIKKDADRGQPWCKVIGAVHPNTSLAVVEFQDPEVHPNDFYYVAIRQKGEHIGESDTLNSTGTNDEYMAFLGPVFIDRVT
jgi:hypothetical protein